MSKQMKYQASAELTPVPRTQNPEPNPENKPQDVQVAFLPMEDHGNKRIHPVSQSSEGYKPLQQTMTGIQL